MHCNSGNSKNHNKNNNNNNNNNNSDRHSNSGGKSNTGTADRLAVCVARVRAVSGFALSRDSPELPRGETLDAAAESLVAADGSWGSRRAYAARVAGHWALLAHTAYASGCVDICHAAIAGGVEFIAHARDEHRCALADLFCCRAKAQIDREEIAAAQETLNRVLEVDGAHAEAFMLLGKISLHRALALDHPTSARDAHLAEAAHYFQCTLNYSSTIAEAYEGMGRVREAQGEIEMSVNFFASAAELESRQPIIPYDRFVYLLE